jgi:hypothetical protein
MPTILQLRRGTTAQHSTFTGAAGELTYNTTKDTLVTHDGLTQGGFEIALADGSNISVSTEQVQDAAATMFTTATHTNITATYDDAAGTLSLAAAEGYGDTDARGAISATDAGGDGSLAYNSSTGAITYTGPSATEVRAHFTGGTGIDITNGSVAVDSTIATKTYADSAASTAVAAVIDSSPAALDTLNELAAALGDDANFSTTVTNSIATKANSADLSTVATTGSYSDITDTPALATVATSGSYSDITGTPTLATVATTGSYSDITGTPTLATVATTGSYNDLSDTPTEGVTTGKAIAMALIFGG